jgi:hypothetical protein
VALERGLSTTLAANAAAQELDAGSLRSRAVRALLAVDKRRARELFQEIPAPQIPALTCADHLAWDVSLFYQTLGEVVSSTFTAQEIRQEEPLKLLERYTRGIGSPVEVGPVARVLASAPLAADAFANLVTVFSGSLKALSGDPRAFRHAVWKNDAGAAISELAAACRRRQMPATALLDAYRTFLVRHFRGTACGAGTPISAGVSFGISSVQQPEADSPLPAAARFFNASLRPEGGAELPPISEEEARPAKIEAVPPPDRACEGQECKDLGSRLNALLTSREGRGLSPEERNAAEWRARLKEYLAAVAAWEGDPALSPLDLFRNKCKLYSDLFNLVPNGPDRDLVLSMFLGYLQQNRPAERAEWLLQINTLIARIFFDPLGLSHTLDLLHNSADPVIALYADLERFAPQPPGRIFALL